MCFSATASFGASAILAVCGIKALTSAHQAKQKFLAAIPFIFAVQQLIEGLLWIGLKNQQALLSEICMYAFLLIAQVLWPFWLPLSFLKLEENGFRKKILLISFLAGCSASAILAYRLLFLTVDAHIMEHHIYYGIASSRWMIITSSILYIIATLVPPFVSALSKSKLLGCFLIFSLLVSKLLFGDYLISVWCFFAAIISMLIVLIVNELKNHVDNPIV
jgi:hypothetical protein